MAIPHPTTAKYLYSPRNGLVFVNTETKRRMCPWAIPCNKLDASDIMNEPQVTMVYAGEYDSRKAEEEVATIADKEEAEAIKTFEDGLRATRLQVMSSEDKGELRQVGGDLDVELSKTMSLETMRTALLNKLDEIQEAALILPQQE
jgi:hypothetical protein